MVKCPAYTVHCAGGLKTVAKIVYKFVMKKIFIIIFIIENTDVYRIVFKMTLFTFTLILRYFNCGSLFLIVSTKSGIRIVT